MACAMLMLYSKLLDVMKRKDLFDDEQERFPKSRGFDFVPTWNAAKRFFLESGVGVKSTRGTMRIL